VTAPIRYSTSVAPWVPAMNLYRADCLPILRSLPPASVAAVVTDPPYGLSDVSSADTIQALTAWVSGDRERVPNGKGFMGNEWDRFVPPPAVWDECFRVLKPGGYMAVFAGSRTADLMGLSIRLAGFEMRDTITWMYGSGFPKSLDIGKALDKAAGAEREIIGKHKAPAGNKPGGASLNMSLYGMPEEAFITAPATDAAKQWDGWGTALKPASEPIVVARKPFPGTVAANVLEHGTGGMNIDGCRVETKPRTTHARGNVQGTYAQPMSWGQNTGHEVEGASKRWPANVVLSHTEWCDEGYCEDGCPVAELDSQSGINTSKSGGLTTKALGIMNDDAWVAKDLPRTGHDDIGGASRFFNTFRYQAKAPKSERPVVNGIAHPTVKPRALMEWLVTLFTPVYGTVLDPFTGSGTTGEAALRLGFNSVVIERDQKYWPLIDKRLGDYLDSLKEKVS
jgi:DNA modification methylase